MKPLLVASAAVLALAGCKAKEEAPAPAPSSTSAMQSSAMAPKAAPTSNGAPGTYAVTDSKGTKSTAMLMADGTYMDSDASGKQTDKGTWKTVSDMKTCFTSDKAGSKPLCYTETKPDASGTFTATPDNGSGAVTVKKTA